MAKTEAELRAKIDALILAFRADREEERQLLADLRASRQNLQTSLQAWRQEQQQDLSNLLVEAQAWRQENLADLQSAVTQLQAACDKLQPVLLKLKAKQATPPQPTTPPHQ